MKAGEQYRVFVNGMLAVHATYSDHGESCEVNEKLVFSLIMMIQIFGLPLSYYPGQSAFL
jgi:hypothetical protein